ncbi:calcium-transporting ATPase [Saccharomycopsis crataegensis]|uniref:P-type Ca(2+) transporter n=1 Tax=Saccharomycopsis crataegensis TaxID=43959 RepID=A0AAV5QWT0_9ASCO|nr:calcium-transporting ATPase [Saccharomycopsis crataegensis]
MPTRANTRLSTILTGTRRHLSTGFNYTIDQLNFHDPKSLNKFNDLVSNNPSNNNNDQPSDNEIQVENIGLTNPVSTKDQLQSFYHQLKTDPVSGLSSEDFSDKDLLHNRTRHFGKNVLPFTPPKPLYKLIYEAMQDKVLIVLSVAAIVSLALGLYETFGQDDEFDDEGKKKPKVEWVEGVAIIVAIFIVVIVGSVNDYQKERQFAKLNAKKEDKKVVAIRDHKETVVSVYDLVVGDVIRVETGDIVPTDGIMISGECECDESALTGETNTIKKYPIASALELYQESNPKNVSSIDLATNSSLQDPFFISGSKVLSGVGHCLVTAVGPNSIHGRTMASLKTEPEVTPLQARLDGLANGISKYGLIAAVILFIVLFIRFCALLPSPHKYSHLPGAQKGEKFLDILIVSITIVVVAVPEGLPLAVTLALAFATTRMAKDMNLVRVLKSCETMGGATAICSDKTGTLTENRMRVIRGFFGFKNDDGSSNNALEFNNTGLNDNHEQDDSLVVMDDINGKVGNESVHNFMVNSVLNSTAFINEETEDPETEALRENECSKSFFGKKKPTIPKRAPEPYVGSKTEVALLILCSQLFGMGTAEESGNVAELRKQTGLLGVEKVVGFIPFESRRKWSGVVVKNQSKSSTESAYAKYTSQSRYTLFIKGAAEILSKQSSHISNSQGGKTALSSETREFVDQKINTYAKGALRSIVLCHLELDVDEDYLKKLGLWGTKGGEAIDNFFESLNSANAPDLKSTPGLVIDSIVGIQDPLREGVSEAVVACQDAGVCVRMVTGDNLITGKSIALGCGIIRPAELDNADVCMEGPVFRKLSQSQMRKVIPGLRVLARSSPEDKRILVRELKAMGEVVAVTGDGTNDAPALKLANVGFSMGISGTDVAREASDIILMTDNFSAIVQAIKWGRCVSVSIKKFIQFQLTVNVTAVVLTFVSAVASSDGKSVLTAVQLLWVNLIMDTLAALALATDKPDKDILKSRPNGTKTPLISVAMWKMIMGQSMMQLVITFVLNFAGKQIFFGDQKINGHQKTQLSAMTFNAFVWLQIFCMFVSRKLDEGDGITTVRGRFTMRNLNFFAHLFRNWYFISIMLIIMGFQILIMFVGGAAFSVAHQTGAMWGTAIICGLLSFPCGILIRLIPDEWVLKCFPTKAFQWLVYIASFGFIRKSKSRPGNERGVVSEDEADTEHEAINESVGASIDKGKDGISGTSSGHEDSTTLDENSGSERAN